MAADRPRWDAPLPRGWGDRVRALALPALLVAIATIGTVRSATLEQSSWQGASFGMFATYDNRTSRSVVVTVSEGRDERRVALPEHLHDHATRLSVVPTDAAARALAADVLDLAEDATTARVEVWRLHLDEDPDGLRVTTSVLATGEASR